MANDADQQSDKQKATPSGYHERNPATAGPEKAGKVRSSTPENRAGKIDPGAPNNATSEGANRDMGKPMAQPDGTAADLNQTESPQGAAQVSTPNPSPGTPGMKSSGKSFRCADAGYSACEWHVEGASETDILPKIKQHAATVHHLELKPEAEQNVRQAIRDAA